MKTLVFVACCLADLFVLHPVWTGREIAVGQFQRGYFERFGNEAGLAMDDAVHPSLAPAFVLAEQGRLAAPPGIVVAAPLEPSTVYEVKSESAPAPYIVVGEAAPLEPPDGTLEQHPDDEARLAAARTLSTQGDRLALVPWDATRPWHQDEARLVALRDSCATGLAATQLRVAANDGGLEIRFGRCVLTDTLASPPNRAPVLAVLSGPSWTQIARRPDWIEHRRIVWPVLAAVFIKVSTLWWALGLPSAVTASMALAGASFFLPVPAILTWPLMLIAGVAASILRGGAVFLRSLPHRFRLPVSLTVFVLTACFVWLLVKQHRATGPNWGNSGGTKPCAVLGYSTVEDRGLRRERGGIRWILDEDCEPCRNNTATMSMGGGTIDWLADAYCRSPPYFGANGNVIFLGGANDDFFSGVASMARLFVLTQQGAESWRRNLITASAASLAGFDTQARDLNDLTRCVLARGAQFLYLHDFIVTDLVGGRDPDRAQMLRGRQDIVERAGGTFIDLLDTFHAEAGISWFDDYVHPSRIAHERIAELACSRLR